MPSQSIQAMNPDCRPSGPSHGMLVTPDSRPMTATSPRFWNRNGGTGSPAEAAADRVGGVLAGLDRALGDARHRLLGRPRLHGRVAQHEDLRVARDREVLPHPDPAVAVRLRADRRRRPSARTSRRGRPPPTASCGPGSPPRPPGVSTRTAVLVDVDDLRPGAHGDARASRAGARPTRRPSAGRSGRIRSIASTSRIRASCGRIERKSRAERVVRDLAERARELHAGRPAADDHERHPCLAEARDGLALGRLERDQDPAPDLGRVVDGLEPGRERRPLVVPEVAVARAGRDDQRVVRDRAAVRQHDLARLGIDPHRLAQQHASCSAASGRSTATAARSPPATAPRSRPGTATAGTGDDSADRPASRRPIARLRSSRAAYSPANPPPITTTRCGAGRVSIPQF